MYTRYNIHYSNCRNCWTQLDVSKLCIYVVVYVDIVYFRSSDAVPLCLYHNYYMTSGCELRNSWVYQFTVITFHPRTNSRAN